jgi:hypothetical protein
MIVYGGREGEGRKKFLNDIHVLDMEKYVWNGNVKIEGNPPE